MKGRHKKSGAASEDPAELVDTLLGSASQSDSNDSDVSDEEAGSGSNSQSGGDSSESEESNDDDEEKPAAAPKQNQKKLIKEVLQCDNCGGNSEDRLCCTLPVSFQ